MIEQYNEKVEQLRRTAQQVIQDNEKHLQEAVKLLIDTAPDEIKEYLNDKRIIFKANVTIEHDL